MMLLQSSRAQAVCVLAVLVVVMQTGISRKSSSRGGAPLCASKTHLRAQSLSLSASLRVLVLQQATALPPRGLSRPSVRPTRTESTVAQFCSTESEALQ